MSSGNSFRCACGGPTRVTDSRPASDGVRRRRECRKANCGARFTTIEVLGENVTDSVGQRVVPITADGMLVQHVKSDLERALRRLRQR